MIDFLGLFGKDGAWTLLVAFLIYTNWLREGRMARRLDSREDTRARQTVQFAHVVNANTAALRAFRRELRRQGAARDGAAATGDDTDDDLEPDDLPQVDDPPSEHQDRRGGRDSEVTSSWFRRVPIVKLCIGSALLLLVLGCSGCGVASSSRQDAHRQSREVVQSVRQEVNPVTGELVELRSVQVSTRAERDEQVRVEDVRLEPPQVLAAAVRAGARAVGQAVAGPAGAEIAERTAAWVWQTVAGTAGLGALGAATKAGLAARRARRLEEELANEEEERLRRIKAMDDYARDIEAAETDDQVRLIKEKHRTRQQALGLYAGLEQDRHGVHRRRV